MFPDEFKTSSIETAMFNEGVKNYPHESCGLVVKSGKKAFAIPCENISSMPENHFLLNPRNYVEVSEKYEIIGVWHTHIELSNKPSDADRTGCESSEMPWLIMNISKDRETGAFRKSEVNVISPCGFMLPYIGRPYVFGVLDCYSLVRDYYRKEFSIRLQDAPRVESWWTKGFNFCVECFEDFGFVNLMPAQRKHPKAGDILLIQISADVPNHVALYEGDDTILHHLYGRLSSRDIYGGYYLKHTAYHVRYKDFL